MVKDIKNVDMEETKKKSCTNSDHQYDICISIESHTDKGSLLYVTIEEKIGSSYIYEVYEKCKKLIKRIIAVSEPNDENWKMHEYHDKNGQHALFFNIVDFTAFELSAIDKGVSYKNDIIVKRIEAVMHDILGSKFKSVRGCDCCCDQHSCKHHKK